MTGPIPKLRLTRYPPPAILYLMFAAIAGLSLIMAIAGTVHLMTPTAYLDAMPPYFSHPIALIYLTGVFEWLGALGLWVPISRRAAAWGLVAFFVAVLPVHIHMIINRVPLFGSASPGVLWGRLLFQGVFIYWAYAIARQRTS